MRLVRCVEFHFCPSNSRVTITLLSGAAILCLRLGLISIVVHSLPVNSSNLRRNIFGCWIFVVCRSLNGVNTHTHTLTDSRTKLKHVDVSIEFAFQASAAVLAFVLLSYEDFNSLLISYSHINFLVDCGEVTRTWKARH